VAVGLVAELELTLVIRAPQLVRYQAGREQCTARSLAPLVHSFDQPMAIEHGMDGADRRHPHVAGHAPEQQLAELARAPVRLVALQADDQSLNLAWQLIGIAHRAP